MNLDSGKYLVMFIAKDGTQWWLSKWDGFRGAVTAGQKGAYTFHWADSARRAANKLVASLDMTGFKVYKVAKDRLEVVN